MKPSILFTPSSFYTRILPTITTVHQARNIYNVLLTYMECLNLMLPLLYYGPEQIEDKELASLLMNEKNAINVYVVELEELICELHKKQRG